MSLCLNYSSIGNDQQSFTIHYTCLVSTVLHIGNVVLTAIPTPTVLTPNIPTMAVSFNKRDYCLGIH